MRISEKQACLMLITLRESLNLADGARVFSLPHDQRGKLYEQILTQQDNVLVDLKEAP